MTSFFLLPEIGMFRAQSLALTSVKVPIELAQSSSICGLAAVTCSGFSFGVFLDCVYPAKFKLFARDVNAHLGAV